MIRRVLTVFGLCLSLAVAPPVAQAAEVKLATYGAMTLAEGYRITVRHDGTHMAIAWRPYGNGAPPLETPASPVETSVTAQLNNETLTPISGSQAALLGLKAEIFVVIDTVDPDRLFDQLAAIRVMLAGANFDRQTWSFYTANRQTERLAQIASDSALAPGWQALRSLLNDKPGGIATASLAPVIEQLATRDGDRKALVLPESLMTVLGPGLTPQGVAGLQAFGISLYPMTGALSAQQQDAYVTLSAATGGHVLPWLDIPPAPYAAINAFAALSQGGTISYAVPASPRQPWRSPQPITVTLSDPTKRLFQLDVPRPASTWASLPWAVISGLAALFILCGMAAFLWFRKENRKPLHVRLEDLSTNAAYDITQWPATLGRGDEADITIANASLKPLHLRLSDNGTGVELKTVDEDDSLTIDGKAAAKHSVYRDCRFALGRLEFQLHFRSGAV